MSDYAVKVTIRNGRILRRMRELGIKSQVELAAKAGVSATTLNSIVALRRAPERTNGQWSHGVENIAAALRCDPEDLFTDAQKTMALPANSMETYMDEASVISLMAGDDMEESAWAKIEVQRLLATLTPRERAITEHMMEGGIYEDADPDGCSRERIRQIHYKALRKMKAASVNFDRASRDAMGVELPKPIPKRDWKPKHIREKEERDAAWVKVNAAGDPLPIYQPPFPLPPRLWLEKDATQLAAERAAQSREYRLALSHDLMGSMNHPDDPYLNGEMK